MSEYFQIHPDNPQPRLIRLAADIVEDDGVVAYPTDSSYALGCRVGNRDGLERIRRIRQFDKRHNFTLVCRDLAEIATYAKVDNAMYRLLRAVTPGPFTFILQASSLVPRIMQHPKRKTIGIRVPENPIAHALLAALDAPLMSATLILPGDELPLSEPEDISERLGEQVDLIIDGGHCSLEPTTVVEFVDGLPGLVREGRGDPALLGL